MNNMRRVSAVLFLVTLLSSYAESLITTPTKGSIRVNTPSLTFNQIISSSALNSSASATQGQFKITESGYYFVSSDLVSNPGRHGLAVIYINASDVVLDLGNRSIVVNQKSTIPSHVGIEIAPGVNNITIMNGTINGEGPIVHTPSNPAHFCCHRDDHGRHESGCDEEHYRPTIHRNNKPAIQTGIIGAHNINVTLENVQIMNCSIAGINFDTTKSLCLKSIHVYATANIGINLYKCVDGVILNSSFSGCSIQTEEHTDNAFGLGADQCRNFALENVATTNNSSKSGCAFGMYLSSCNGFICDKINTSSNTVTGSGKLCAGVRLMNSSGCAFTDSSSNNNRGIHKSTSALGFSIAHRSNGNTFNNCESMNNIGGDSAAGFWISASRSTTFHKCSSTGNSSVNSSAYGFFSSGGSTHNFIRECKANANYSAIGTAYGIAMSNEKRSVIEKCEASSNDGGAGSAYGIALLDTCVNIVVEYNKIFTNAATKTHYGFKDFAANSTTLLRGNTAFGQGRSFINGYSSILEDTGKMNYMLKYAPGGDQMNIQLLIKESDIANLNTFESSSVNWFNYSILGGNE